MLSFEKLREREFSRLDRQRHTYADYTGSALYGESQIRAHVSALNAGVFGNPHADSPASKLSTDLIDRVRGIVLEFFGVDPSTHDVCFTANATAAAKLVAESYPFDPSSTFAISVDNHNSINGIREYARRAGASIEAVRLDRGELPPASAGLFAFPAQSNFSGRLYPLSLVEDAHARGFDVLLDVAAFAPSHPLNLRACRADYAVLSFYKLFGYPTGVGALVARREALAKLRRPWFAGGTVAYASVGADTHRLRPRHEAFEDGTPNFLSIAALPTGFALLDEIGLDRIAAHVDRLTALFLEDIAPFATMYGTTTFNIDGMPYWAVEEEARRANISLRGGCFCNPGAAEIAFNLDADRIAFCFDSLAEDFTVERFASCAEKSIGAVRVSFGAANNADDVHRIAEFLRSLSTSACRVGEAP